MKQDYIEIAVNKNKISIVNTEAYISGSVNVNHIKIDLDEFWEGLSVYPTFKVKGDVTSLNPEQIVDDIITIPAGAFNTKYENNTLYFGLYGVDGNGSTVLVTEYYPLGKLRKGVILSDEELDPSGDLRREVEFIKNNYVTNGEFNKLITGAVVVKQAERATKDANGEDIAQTYATKQELEQLNSIRIRNKGVLEATKTTVQEIATQYIIDEYDRRPQHLDGLIITVTDLDDDKVLYIYTNESNTWIDAGVNSVDLTNYVQFNNFNEDFTINETTKKISVNNNKIKNTPTGMEIAEGSSLVLTKNVIEGYTPEKVTINPDIGVTVENTNFNGTILTKYTSEGIQITSPNSFPLIQYNTKDLITIDNNDIVFFNGFNYKVGTKKILTEQTISDIMGMGLTYDGAHIHTLNNYLQNGNKENSLYMLGNTVSGNATFAIGEETSASGEATFSNGIGTIASIRGMSAIGKYNVTPTQGTLFAIGNGLSATDRNNIITVTTNGITVNKERANVSGRDYVELAMDNNEMINITLCNNATGDVIELFDNRIVISGNGVGKYDLNPQVILKADSISYTPNWYDEQPIVMPLTDIIKPKISVTSNETSGTLTPEQLLLIETYDNITFVFNGHTMNQYDKTSYYTISNGVVIQITFDTFVLSPTYGKWTKTETSINDKENKGKLTINNTEYTVRTSTTDEGQTGYITFVLG